MTNRLRLSFRISYCY